MATTIPNRSPLIVSPHLYLGDVTGRPLDYGMVFFGEPNKDPEFYPIKVFSDKELKNELAQPVRTKGGFLNQFGDIVEVFAYEGVYSVKVLDQYGRKIFYKAEVAKQTIEDVTSDVVDAAQVEINKRMKQLDETINIAAAAGAGENGWTTELVEENGVTQRQINAKQKIKNLEIVSIKDFGAKGDGVADDTQAIKNAVNSGNKRIFAPDGTYNTTAPINIPEGVSLIGFGQARTTFNKKHDGDAFVLNNGLAYNGVLIGGFSIIGNDTYKNKGTGISATHAVRVNFSDINVSDFAVGVSFDTCYGCNTNNITLDRCGTSLSIYQSNHNNFRLTTIISNGGIGVKMWGECYSNHYDSIDIEYSLYPLVFESGVSNVVFTSYYAEFNTHGAKLGKGVSNITFNGAFNSSVPMFDDSCEAEAVAVNGLTDLYPKGVGGVSLSGNLGNPKISTVQNDAIFQNGALSAAYDFSDFSKFGLNAGSYADWSGQPFINFVNSQDLSNATQWVGGGDVTANGTLLGQQVYTFAAKAYRTHTIGVGGAMANRTFTVCLLVKGQPGSLFELRQGDNVTATERKQYSIGTSGYHYVFFTQTWGSASTGGNINFVITNTGDSPLDCLLPCVYESKGALPVTTRTRNDTGYTNYPLVNYKNFGKVVHVYGDAQPTTGGWAVGDTVWSTNPSTAAAWVCVATGTPGNWKKLALTD